MGWWSTHVMGGDTPADIRTDIQESDLTLHDVSPGKFRKLMDGSNPCNQIGFRIENKTIGWQTLGYMMLERGHRMRPSTLAEVMNAVSSDEWSTDSTERAETMANFMKIVKDNSSLFSRKADAACVKLTCSESRLLFQEICSLDLSFKPYKKSWKKLREVVEVEMNGLISSVESAVLQDLIHTKQVQVIRNKKLLNKINNHEQTRG